VRRPRHPSPRAAATPHPRRLQLQRQQCRSLIAARDTEATPRTARGHHSSRFVRDRVFQALRSKVKDPRSKGTTPPTPAATTPSRTTSHGDATHRTRGQPRKARQRAPNAREATARSRALPAARRRPGRLVNVDELPTSPEAAASNGRAPSRSPSRARRLGGPLVQPLPRYRGWRAAHLPLLVIVSSPTPRRRSSLWQLQALAQLGRNLVLSNQRQQAFNFTPCFHAALPITTEERSDICYANVFYYSVF
jgi:hypothetical protein